MPKSSKKAAKTSAPKSKSAPKKGAPRGRATEPTVPPLVARLETMGYRAHCQTEAHFPCSTLLVPDIPAAQYWAEARHNEAEHAECVFKLERVLFDQTTYHILSAVAELPEVPIRGPIEWSDDEPYDLGPIWEQMSVEDMKALKDIPPAALKAAEAAHAARAPILAEAPESEEEAEEEEEAASPIGQSHPAPQSENLASHRPSGHRALKVSSVDHTRTIKTSHAKPVRWLKAKGKKRV